MVPSQFRNSYRIQKVELHNANRGLTMAKEQNGLHKQGSLTIRTANEPDPLLVYTAFTSFAIVEETSVFPQPRLILYLN